MAALAANCDLVKIIVSLLANAHCEASVTAEHPRAGVTVEIEWPATVVGSRRIVRCVHAYNDPYYAHRDCTLSVVDQRPTWKDANASLCPGPPFSRGVDRLARFMVSITYRLSYRASRV